ncbi:MAG TPA: hypothetical protein VL354_14780 [Spirochaetia bacterium]|nr:hypothetical protein [Spirochaetia bacterium]
MTPEEELARLNRVIHQYETVYKTTTDKEQRQRVEKQLKDLKQEKEKFLATNTVAEKPAENEQGSDELAELPLLQRLIAREAGLQEGRRLAPLWAPDARPTSVQREVYHLMLYVSWFRDEFLPFLTEKRLKLDFKYSLDRDGFYAQFQEVERKLDGFREENGRLAAGMAGHELELEMRKRLGKLRREIEADAAKLFHAVRSFAQELSEDADGDGVKCLNAKDRVTFDSIEGRRALEGRTVRKSLEAMARLASEIVTFLQVPDMESQES